MAFEYGYRDKDDNKTNFDEFERFNRVWKEPGHRNVVGLIVGIAKHIEKGHDWVEYSKFETVS